MRLFGKARGSGRRSGPRLKSPMAATLTAGNLQYQTVLIDISRTGARLRGRTLPATGDQLAFKADAVEARCEVVWCKDDSCGVEFETPIAAAEVQRLRFEGGDLGA